MVEVSVTALAYVIRTLSEHCEHIPHRNSKLTHLLQDCISLSPYETPSRGDREPDLGSYHNHACPFAQTIHPLANLELCQAPAMFCTQGLC